MTLTLLLTSLQINNRYTKEQDLEQYLHKTITGSNSYLVSWVRLLNIV